MYSVEFSTTSAGRERQALLTSLVSRGSYCVCADTIVSMNRTVFHAIDRRLTYWLAEHGLTMLRISIGIIFVWFGVLKFWPGLSPADQLATDTIDKLSFGLVSQDVARVLLAVLETAIGIGLLTGRFLRLTLLMLVFQMLGAATPLFLFPELTWSQPFVPTLEGQYIIKNLVVVSAALTIGATVRGGRLVDDPKNIISTPGSPWSPRDT